MRVRCLGAQVKEQEISFFLFSLSFSISFNSWDPTENWMERECRPDIFVEGEDLECPRVKGGSLQLQFCRRGCQAAVALAGSYVEPGSSGACPTRPSDQRPGEGGREKKRHTRRREIKRAARSHSYERSLRSKDGVGREPSTFRSTRLNRRGAK